jgi:hypothetical protein
MSGAWRDSIAGGSELVLISGLLPLNQTELERESFMMATGQPVDFLFSALWEMTARPAAQRPTTGCGIVSR